MSEVTENPSVVRFCKIIGGYGREQDRINAYELLEMKGVIIGLEATGADTAIHMLKRLHNRCVELEAQELERKESK